MDAEFVEKIESEGDTDAPSDLTRRRGIPPMRTLLIVGDVFSSKSLWFRFVEIWLGRLEVSNRLVRHEGAGGQRTLLERYAGPVPVRAGAL